MKIAVVTCSPKNDYPRALSLRTAFAAAPGVTTVIIRNRRTNLLRYPEVMYKLCKARTGIGGSRPDAYVLTFRGYEMMLFLRLTLIRKPIIFDELINFTEWMVEQGRLTSDSRSYRLFRKWNSWVVRRCRFILADTEAHANYSAILNKLSIKQYKVLPVCAEENLFRPAAKNEQSKKEPFTVLYYGHMVALHGLDYVLKASEILKDRPDIVFRLAGGKKNSQVAKACARAAQAGAHVTHQSWLPFKDLPLAIRRAGITLGGPFGNTLQADFVVTGKTYQVLACAAPVLIGKNQVNGSFYDKVNCLMVPQADPKALAAAIRWAADHPKELASIGQAGRKLYEKKFSQAVVNKTVQELVQQL